MAKSKDKLEIYAKAAKEAEEHFSKIDNLVRLIADDFRSENSTQNAVSSIFSTLSAVGVPRLMAIELVEAAKKYHTVPKTELGRLLYE